MKSMKAAPATVMDVARSAGVSVGTVSRVLNGASNISPENLAKVEQAMGELGYRKHHSAGLLASRKSGSSARTGNIGLVFADAGPAWANHPLIAAYTMGVERACQEKGFHPLVELAADDELPRCVREGKVDGLLVKTTHRMPNWIGSLPDRLPVILVSVNDPTVDLPQVAPDNQGAGWVVTDYLWEKGHRHIAFLCTEASHPMFVARFHGYESYLRQREAFEPALVIMESRKSSTIPPPEASPPDVSAHLSRLLALPDAQRPTAIITANDWIALGLYTALEQADLRVGQDMSVVGFDNEPAVCAILQPNLTSYAIPFGDVAHAAALKAITSIQFPDELRNRALHLIRGHIVERQSVHTPPPESALPSFHP